MEGHKVECIEAHKEEDLMEVAPEWEAVDKKWKKVLEKFGFTEKKTYICIVFNYWDRKQN